MDLKLKGKKALVTGSTAGIGYAIALQLAHEGADVVINGRTAKRVNEAITKIKEKAGSTTITGVAADFAEVKQIDQLIKDLPQVDILINNVGIFEPKAFQDITDVDWLKFFEVNVLSGIRLAKAYFDKMLKRNDGRIIFISSESGLQIPQEMIHYGVTKTAQIAVSRGLAELTRGTNVTVNTVLPGPTMSEGVGGFIESLSKDHGKSIEAVEKDFFQNMRPTSILQRFLTPAEIANTVTYLASPLSIATNGATVRADGGVIKTAF